MSAHTFFLRFVAQVLIVTLVPGMLPVPASAALPPPDRSPLIPDLSLADSVPLALVVLIAGDEEVAPCALVSAPSHPFMPSKYHRARWLDPRVGRFVGMDPWAGSPLDPASLHRYLYSNLSPINRSDPTGRVSTVESLSVVYIMTTLASVQGLVGAAIMDQVEYGGDAGLKSLAIGAVVGVIFIGVGIALKMFGTSVRRVPLGLPPGAPAVIDVLPGTYMAHEMAQIERIVHWRGGLFKGTPTPNVAGIDGWLEGATVSLKTGNTTNAIFNVADEAAIKASRAGYSGVELFIDSRTLAASQVVREVPRPLQRVLREGYISAVNIETRDGWIRVIQ